MLPANGDVGFMSILFTESRARKCANGGWKGPPTRSLPKPNGRSAFYTRITEMTKKYQPHGSKRPLPILKDAPMPRHTGFYMACILPD